MPEVQLAGHIRRRDGDHERLAGVVDDRLEVAALFPPRIELAFDGVEIVGFGKIDFRHGKNPLLTLPPHPASAPEKLRSSGHPLPPPIMGGGRGQGEGEGLELKNPPPTEGEGLNASVVPPRFVPAIAGARLPR